MTQRAATSQTSTPRAGPPTAIAPPSDLATFEGPAEELAARVLVIQSRLGGATHAAMLADLGDGNLDLLALVHGTSDQASGIPPEQSNTAAPSAPEWLNASRRDIEAALHTNRAAAGLIDADRSAVVVPCTQDATLDGVRSIILVFIIESTDPVEVDHARARLVDASALTALVAARLTLGTIATREAALRHACELLGAVNAQPGFVAAAMTFVNEIASRLKSRRVSLGLVRGRDTRAVAFSHTERFVRASALVREIESAMDEAVDQDTDTAFPHPPEATFIARQAAEVSRRHGPSCVSILVLRSPQETKSGGGPVGALLIERDPESPLDSAETVWLRTALDLATPRLLELDERDAWFGRRWSIRARRSASSAASPKGAAWKLGILAAGAGVVSLFIIPTDLKSRGTFIAEAAERRVVAAPFEGTLAEVRAKVGDRAVANTTLLATLDTTDLSLKLAEARAQREGLRRQGEAARAGPATGSGSIGAIAEARLFEAQAAEADARVKLLESRLEKSRLIAPITGVVTVGDIDRLRGAAVATGDTLFEIASDGTLAATIAVPEARAADVALGQPATLTPTGRPDQSIAAEVDRIAPTAELVNLQNVVKVRAKLLGEAPAWLKPGMEGVASVTTGRASLMHAWTRGASDWLRMKLWW